MLCPTSHLDLYMRRSHSVNIMISQEQGESGKEDSENGEDLSSHTIPGISECSERSPSVNDEPSVDCSEKSISVQKYEEEWELLYCRDDPDLGELRRRAVTGNLRASRFRSVCWRALLGVFSNDKNNWLKELRRFRQHYQQMSQEFCIDPWENSNPEDNPLNQNVGSTWHQHFCDNELKAVIRQDVVRTFPGVDFFRKESVQRVMLNVLFVYARENPEMCYRQGMHEILAPLLFVLHCDHQALLHTKEQVPVSDSINEILDPEYLEADSYSLFCLIMDGISCYYKVNDTAPTATGYFPPNLQSPVPPPGGKGKENEILHHLESIKENLLVPNDKELAEYLNRLEITLPVFGIRWLRLLFGREFPLQDLLVLWDAIFAEGKDFGLVHYIVVAMLVAIRSQLLDSDYTTCLMHLMRYPGAVDISFVIEHALHLKDHQKYSRPTVTGFPIIQRKSVGLTDSCPVGVHSGRNTHSAKTVMSLNRGEKGQQRKSRVAAGSSLSDRFKKLSTKSGQWSPVKTHRSNSIHGEGETSTASRNAAGTGVVEGFALNDPKVLISELHHARAVMQVCRLRIAQYHSILSEAINPVEQSTAQQALDGMYELCNLLDYRTRSNFPPDVEPAYEAGELRVEASPPVITVPQVIPHRRSATPPNQLPLRPVPDKVRRREIARTATGASHSVLPNHGVLNVPLETFKESLDVPPGSTKGFPLSDPLHPIKELGSSYFKSSDDRPLLAAYFVD